MLKAFDYSIEPKRSYSSYSSNNCYDSLSIYDGPASYSRNLAKLCGTSKRSDAIVSRSNTMYLKFVSDSGTSYKGFNISYSVLGKCTQLKSIYKF